MLPIFLSCAVGVALGTAFYYCVRLRMVLGPLTRERFGNWARQLVWIVCIAIMVLLANFALRLLRSLLVGAALSFDQFVYEAVFALTALAVGFGLVYRHTALNH